MPVCPKCGEELDHLVRWQSGENKSFVFADKEQMEEDVEFVSNNQVDDYECPYCNETLFSDYNKAQAFIES